jgi:hypothetical protein
MQLWLLLLLVQHCILLLLQQHWLLLALRVCSIDCLRLQLLISAAGAALRTGAATAVQHCLHFCWCAAAASFVGTALVVAALHHLFATAGAVLWTAAAAVGTELEDGAAALFALCLYSLVWYLASASAKVSVFGIS